MLEIIELIFSIIGIYGFFTENLICIVVGLVVIIICDFIDILIKSHNPITILLACLLAIGASIANKNPLISFTITLCMENFIMTSITLLMVVISILQKNNKGKQKDNSKKVNSNSNGEGLNSIINNPIKLQNIIDGKEKIDEKYFLERQNPYTGKTIKDYNDILEYLMEYQKDYNNVNS